jgi:hypothetical protein
VNRISRSIERSAAFSRSGEHREILTDNLSAMGLPRPVWIAGCQAPRVGIAGQQAFLVTGPVLVISTIRIIAYRPELAGQT